MSTIFKKIMDTLSITDKSHTEKKGKTGFKTRIVVESKKNGSTINTSVYENKTALLGRLHLIENFFDVMPNSAQHIFLSDNMMGAKDEDPVKFTCPYNLSTLEDKRPKSDISYFRRRRVGWFCVGGGGLSNTISTGTASSHDTNSKLYNMIPFRIVRKTTADDVGLSTSEASQYRGKTLITIGSNQYWAYYFKKFTLEGDGINMNVNGNEYDVCWNDTEADLKESVNFDKGQILQIFAKFNLSITEKEFREWFEIVNSTTDGASFSEIGLVSGLECTSDGGIDAVITKEDYDTNSPNSLKAEVWDAELASHLTLNPQSLSGTDTSFNIAYSIHA